MTPPARYIFTLLIIFMTAFLISACTHTPPVEDSDDENVGVVDDNEDEEEVDEEEPEEEEPEDTEDPDLEEDTTDDDAEVDEEEDTDEDADSSEKASISGKFCYPTSPIPSNLRAFVKNKKTGYYWYVSAQNKTTWTLSELEPATYIVYLAGPDGSGLEEGRYTNSDNSFKEIVVKAGDDITGVEPCDFDF